MTVAPRLIPVEEESAWQELLTRCGQPTAFHDWKWLSLAGQLLGLDFTPMAAVVSESAIAAVPLLVKRRGPLRVVNWLPFPYVGPVVDNDQADVCLRALDAWQTGRRVAVNQASFAPAFEVPANAFEGTSFTPSYDWTLVVRADSTDVAWSALNSSVRNKLKRCDRLGVKIETLTPAAAEKLPALINDAFERHGAASPYPDVVGRELWRAFESDADVRMAQATLDGEVVGVHATLARGEKAYLWFAGTTSAGRSSGAGVALYWDAITWSIGRGAQLDLVGIPNENIRQYKEQFGTSPESFIVARSTPFRSYLRAQRLSTRMARGARNITSYIAEQGVKGRRSR